MHKNLKPPLWTFLVKFYSRKNTFLAYCNYKKKFKQQIWFKYWIFLGSPISIILLFEIQDGEHKRRDQLGVGPVEWYLTAQSQDTSAKWEKVRVTDGNLRRNTPLFNKNWLRKLNLRENSLLQKILVMPKESHQGCASNQETNRKESLVSSQSWICKFSHFY